MKIEQDLANALLRSEVISPALLDLPTHSYGARAGFRKGLSMRKDKLVCGLVVAGGGDPGQRALLRNPHDSLFFSVAHFFAIPCAFFFWKKVKTHPFGQKRQHLESKIQYENHDGNDRELPCGQDKFISQNYADHSPKG